PLVDVAPRPHGDHRARPADDIARRPGGGRLHRDGQPRPVPGPAGLRRHPPARAPARRLVDDPARPAGGRAVPLRRRPLRGPETRPDAWSTIPLDRLVLVLCSYDAAFYEDWKLLRRQIASALSELDQATHVAR